MTFEETTQRYILRHGLMSKGKSYVVALSGGPDSVALLCALTNLGYEVHAAHCNFHLRDEESDRDETFCKGLCKKSNIPLHIAHFDTITYAQLHKVSIEMAARDLRYRWFAQLCHDIGADGVCVAHHQDDQVETVLLNMLRGTGLKGLVGMKPRATSEQWGESCEIIRPLLGVSERQVMDYLAHLQQDFVIDSSNLNNDVKRNMLRLDILPLLEKVTPAAKQNIIRMTENLAETQNIVEESLRHSIDETQCPQSTTTPFAPSELILAAYDMQKLKSFPAPLTLLWEILSRYGFNRTQVGEICNSKSDNGEWRSGCHIALLSHNKLTIADLKLWDTPLPEMQFPEPGLYQYAGKHVRITLATTGNGFKARKSPYSASIDAAKASFPLTLRQAHAGDRFTPFGMCGSKLVADYLKDRKRDIATRRKHPILADANGNIVWIPGECISNKCKISPQGTSQAIIIEIEQ